MQIITCWRCGLPGHAAAECRPPAARTEAELRERFAHFIELVRAGRISLARKRDWVKAEWKAFNDLKAKEKPK